MEDDNRINNLGNGKYSVLIGHQAYTVVTKLDEKRFNRAALLAASVADSFPKNLTQGDILFLSLLSLAKEIDQISEKTNAIEHKFAAHVTEKSDLLS